MKATQVPYRMIISGGGTGGHVYPAIAIAQAFQQRFAEAEILFVGALGKMEMEKVPEAGFHIEGLPIRGFQRKLSWANLSFPFKLLQSLMMSRKIVKRFKPDVAVGVGGYASGPLLRVAVQKNIPAIVQEQNSHAGITNKLLSSKVQKICVAYPGMEKFFPSEKIVFTGNPVRKDILNLEAKKPDALKYFNLEANRPVLLVLGGSLGARTINNSICKGLNLLVNAGVQVLWQCGAFYHEEMKKCLANVDAPNGVHLHSFIKAMDLAYAASDVVISRAGALSVSELSVAGKPTIFVPSPNVAEDHQTKNAMSMVSQKAALLVKDQVAEEELIAATMALLNNNQLQRELSQNMQRISKPNAAEEIVNEIEKLIA